MRAALRVLTAMTLAAVVCLSAASYPVLAQGTVLREQAFSDLTGSQGRYLNILGALGLVKGDGGFGGPCRPWDEVTRAEFAVLVVRLLELDADFKPPDSFSVAGGDTVTRFSDEADIPVWAEEAIRICTALGVVSGVPDNVGGSAFRPNQTILGAEAAAMLLRALDNARSISYGWPAGYIYRASETGLFAADVTPGDWRFIEPLTPVSRAEMAYLLYRALLCQRGYRRGADGEAGYEYPSIGGRLASYVTVRDVHLLARSLVGIDGRTYRLAPAVVAAGVDDPSEAVGRRLYVLHNTRGQVVYLERRAGGETVTGTVTGLTVRPDGLGVQSIALDGGRPVACRPGAVVELNGRRWPFPPDVLLPTATATVILQDGSAVYVSIVQEDLPEVVLKSIALDPERPEDDGTLLVGIPFEPGTLKVAVDARTEIYLNGEPARLYELRERDICYVATEGDVHKRALRVYAYRNQVQGTIAQVARRYMAEGSRLEVGVSNPGTLDIVPCAEACARVVSVDMVGRDVVLCLNREGEAAYFSDPGPAPGRPSAVRIVSVMKAAGSRLCTVEWCGEELTYPLLSGEPVPGSLQLITVTRDGAISSLQSVEPALYTASVANVDLGLGRVTLTSQWGTWSLDATRVPAFALGEGGGVGPAIGISDLRAGQAVWLDDPGARLAKRANALTGNAHLAKQERSAD